MLKTLQKQQRFYPHRAADRRRDHRHPGCHRHSAVCSISGKGIQQRRQLGREELEDRPGSL